MSVFSSFLTAASPYISQASNALGSYNAGQKQEEDTNLQKALMAAQFKRQQQQDTFANALKQSQADAAAATSRFRGAQTDKILNTPVPPLRDPVKDKNDEYQYTLDHPKPVKDPFELHKQERDYDNAHPAEARDAFTTFPDYDQQDPTAPPVTRTFNTRTGQPGQPVGTGKTPVTKIESATNTAANARLQAAVSEMNNAHGAMSDYEHALANKTANISGLAQFMGSVANTFTHDDPVSKAAQTAALATLNTVNPDLARYIRRGLSFAEGESMISQRPSDFRTRMAAFLSTAASGASPEMISDIESRRTSILNPLNSVVKPAGGGRGGGGQPTTGAKDVPGNITLPGGSSTEAAWASKNPPHAGESFDAYHARYLKAQAP